MRKMKKRLIVFITVPMQKQIPEYVYYLASEIRKLEGTFYIAVNGILTEKSRDRLRAVCDKIVLRKNEDYDIGAYREIVLGQAAEGKLNDYEEMVLLNDSFYGPIYPFSDLFEEMEKREADFWGLSAHPKTKVRDQYFIEEHLQSYFLVIRERMLLSADFRKFWMELPSKIASRELAIESFEKKFTSHFSRLGYSWSAYIDKSLFTNKRKELNYNPYAYSSLELIETYRYPVLKRSIIPLKSMEHFANWDDAMKCLQYMDENTDYDIDLIWDDLLKRFDVNMLKNYLHINYVITSDKTSVTNKKLLFILYGGYEMKQIPEFFRQLGDVITCNYDRSSLTMDFLMDYQYICFFNFGYMKEDTFFCEKKTIYENLVENLTKDQYYVSNVIDLFQRKPRLGVLFVSDPYFSEIFDSCRKKQWKHEKYAEMKDLAEERQYHCVVTKEWMPEVGVGSFWCRAEIFRQEKGFLLLTEILDQGMDSISCLPYLCQHYGYLTGEVISDACAAERLCNYKYALSAITDASYGIESKKLNDYHIQFCKQVIRPQIIEFCSAYDYIYIYGAGAYGVIYADLLDHEKIAYEGFLVSRGQHKDEMLLGKPVCYLDEIQKTAEKVGILAAVPPQVQPVIRKLCETQNYHNLYCFEARIANK